MSYNRIQYRIVLNILIQYHVLRYRVLKYASLHTKLCCTFAMKQYHYQYILYHTIQYNIWIKIKVWVGGGLI